MKVFNFGLLLLLVFLACASSGPDPKVIAKGKEVYSKYCVACHGQDGAMAINGAKDLNASIMSFEERLAIIKEGKNMMTAFENVLKPEEIEAVAHFTKETFAKKE